MEARRVTASHGWDWINQGGRLLFQKLGTCLLFFAVTLVIWKLIYLVPHVGFLIATLLTPLAIGVFGIACRDLQHGRPFMPNELLFTLKPFATRLLRIGFINLAGLIVMAGVIVMITRDPILAMATLGDWQLYDRVMEKEITSAMYTGVLLASAASFILFFASWFSPLLVVFNGMKPEDAMKNSFKASFYNVGPFLLFGLVLAGSWVGYTIVMYLLPSAILVPLGQRELLLPAIKFLSAFYWPFVAPIIYAAHYASYADVFAPQSS